MSTVQPRAPSDQVQSGASPRHPEPAPANGSAWAPLRQPVFRGLWLAALAAGIGTWMQTVGAAWLMTSLDAAPVMVALAQAATTLPLVLLALPAGALADIVDGRRLLLGTLLWTMLVVASLGVLTRAGLTTPWLLLAFTFLYALGTALSLPVWQAVLLGAVPADDLPAAISLGGVNTNLARAVGPALAGGILAIAGPGESFLLNTVPLVLALILLLPLRPRRAASTLPPEHLVGAVHAGVRFVHYAPPLQAALIRSTAFVVCGSALWALLPLVARESFHLGPAGYGGLLACLGLGAVVGAALLPALRARLGVERLLAASTLTFAGATLGLAHVPLFVAVCLALVAGGTAWLALLSLFLAAGQAVVPGWVRARVIAVQLLVFFLGMTVGSILWGAVAQAVGVPLALTLAAVAMAGTLALARRLSLAAGEGIDLRPLHEWREPVLCSEPGVEQGPVYVLVEYTIDPADLERFAGAMAEVRLERLRNGAMRWDLLSDPARPGRYVECIVVESWGEHVRAHARVTGTDHQADERAYAYHRGDDPPAVTHFVAEPLHR